MLMDNLNQLSPLAGSETFCLPVTKQEIGKQFDRALPFPEKESKRSGESTLSGLSLFIDLDISPELQRKVDLN